MQHLKLQPGHSCEDSWPELFAGDQVYTSEVQRWCPDRQCFAAINDQLPTGQADVFEVLSDCLRTAHVAW